LWKFFFKIELKRRSQADSSGPGMPIAAFEALKWLEIISKSKGQMHIFGTFQKIVN